MSQKTKKEAAAAPKKEVVVPKKDTPDQITSLHIAFKDSLSKYDEVSSFQRGRFLLSVPLPPQDIKIYERQLIQVHYF